MEVWMKSVVTLLVINKIAELPQVAIRSVLNNSNADVIVGYLNNEDIYSLPKSPRITYLRLDTLLDEEITGEYRDFSETIFYQIVQFKWQLLLKVLDLQYEFIIYTDLDVIWLRNPIDGIERAFQDNVNMQIQIQNFSSEPNEPRLCMGFVAFRNSNFNLLLIQECQKNHKNAFSLTSHVGDDDVITNYFVRNSLYREIFLLPQGTFPVGSFLNLYATRPIFPGLSSPLPYIFHLNYVVGLRNKRLMLRLLRLARPLRHELNGLKFWRLEIGLKKLKIYLHKIKNGLMS
jgi:hypothetical protein